MLQGLSPVYMPSLGWRWLLAVILLISLSGCQTSPPVDTASSRDYRPHLPAPDVRAPAAVALQLLYQQHYLWHGTPYRMGGNNRSGIDCSGFVQVTYRDLFGIDLPRRTDQQAHVGRQITKSELQPGDLIFFREGRHVGIYLENRKFLHASTRRGVIISSLDNSYWSQRFWRAVQIRDHGYTTSAYQP